MTSLDDLCRQAGLTWIYRDGAGRMQEAPEESRRAVLAALAQGTNPGPNTSLAIVAGRPRDWGPVSYTHLTLPTNREV